MANIQFKSDNQNQSVLFPSRLDENIPAIHPVRIVNEIVDKLDIRDLLSEYKGGGTSAYHPRMLLKILIYGYLNNLYSSRRIAQQLTENIHFMWLSGRQTPDFRTINDFRSKRLKGRINALFTSVVQLMAEEGFVSLTTQYIDGTKLESASNRYTFVWRRSVETHKSRLEEKIRKVFDLIEQAITEDNTSALESELSGMSSTELRERLARLTSRLPQPSAPVKKACRELETKLLPKLQEYEEKLDICGERNSYSKTDHDATFMRMKEDHMKNGQLKPAYNVQISTENQIITHFGIYQRPGDTALLIPYLESFKQRYGLNDLCGHTVVADSGYGSEQNYEYMEQGGITAYVKYNYFHKEQKKAYVNNPFLPQNLVYNPDGDFIICPSGQKMNFTGTKNNISDLGYQSQSSLYQAENCQDCPLRTQCHKAKGNRVIELNHKLLAYRRRAKELLMSEEGLRHRSKRPVEVEAVFGQLKKNRMFNRFRMRGIKKVEIEFGLLAMAHNLLKMIKNRVKSCFLCIYTKNWNTFEENQTRKSSIKKKRERREKNTKKKTDRIFYFSVSLIISYLRRIFRNTQMEVLNLVLVYLQNLMHADVTIHKEETDQVWFNEARSISDFNSHLMIGEIMCTSFLADWVERAGKDPVLMKVIMERFNQFNQLYRYDDNFGWTHRYLTIREQGALLALNDLPAVTRETIARYLILQHTSLERQQKLFYCRESFLKQEYKLRLTPTELLELSLSLLASGKLEGDSKSVTQIGTVRFLADCLGLDFPANYDSLMYQLKEREQLTKFMDELRQSLIAYLRKKNG